MKLVIDFDEDKLDFFKLVRLYKELKAGKEIIVFDNIKIRLQEAESKK
jgi:hypothetical protein